MGGRWMSVSFITCTGPWGFSSRGSMPCIAIDWEVDAARRMYGEALHSLRVRLGCEGVRSGGVLRFSVYDHCAFRVLCCMFHKQTDGHTTLAYAQLASEMEHVCDTIGEHAGMRARTHTHIKGVLQQHCKSCYKLSVGQSIDSVRQPINLMVMSHNHPPGDTDFGTNVGGILAKTGVPD